MSTVFVVAPYEAGQYVVLDAGASLRGVAGVRQDGAWSPRPVQLVSQERRRTLDVVDLPYLEGSDLLVVKDAALPLLVDVLAPCVELLPLSCVQEPLTLVNVLSVVDALDEESSDIRRFSTGRVMRVDRPAFRPEALPESGMFRVPQSLGRMFCTEVTAALLRERVTGLNLRPVWEG